MTVAGYQPQDLNRTQFSQLGLGKKTTWLDSRNGLKWDKNGLK